jgi:hypothetical protein
MNDQPGIATGLLLVIVGLWIGARTFIHDASGKNLVDRLIDLAGGDSSSSSASSDPNAPDPSKGLNIPGTSTHVGPVNVASGPAGKLGPVPIAPIGQGPTLGVKTPLGSVGIQTGTRPHVKIPFLPPLPVPVPIP